jgi:ribonuclease Z
VDLRLVFLGTAGAVPTVDRGPSALLIIRGGERHLIDCGEGTQRQLMRSVGISRLDRIFITHLHGDHYLGLPGLLKTLSLQAREEPLHLYGPAGLAELFHVAQRLLGRFSFPVVLHDVAPGFTVEGQDYQIRAGRSDHGLPSVAWSLEEEDRPGRFHPEQAIALGVTPGPDFRRLQMGETITLSNGVVVTPDQVMDEARPGRKVVVTGDTRPAQSVIEFAAGASVLVHDSTFAESEHERALETKHSTSREAAVVAREACVDLLALTHVSSRHGRRELVDEARSVFPRSILPRDFDEVLVPYPDKGEPRLLKPSERLSAGEQSHPGEEATVAG